MNQLSKVALITTAAALCACSALESGKVDYRSATAVKSPSLDVPPDLTQLSKDTRYIVVDGAVSASSVKALPAATASSTVAALSLGDVRVERAGNQRWLVVNRPAEKLWDPVRDFWRENGFSLVLDQRELGIMETEWNENRAKIPMDVVRSTLGKLIDWMYSTSERDKFRTRLERNANGSTEIFISHRGVMEVFDSAAKDRTVWQPRPIDPELEAEFLSRLMVKLGSNPEQAKAQLAGSPAKSSATVTSDNGVAVVRIEEGFDRAWRRVGLALDRTGFTVEDRDRKQGIYFVRYVAPDGDTAEPGFFSRLFSSSSKTTDASKFRITVRSQGDVTLVSVLNDQGAADSGTTAQRIVKLLAEDIK